MDELQNYKTVFVVGNGFDLNLGLKTSYKDFMKSHWFSDIAYSGAYPFTFRQLIKA